jgi:hypothetical protein
MFSAHPRLGQPSFQKARLSTGCISFGATITCRGIAALHYTVQMIDGHKRESHVPETRSLSGIRPVRPQVIRPQVIHTMLSLRRLVPLVILILGFPVLAFCTVCNPTPGPPGVNPYPYEDTVDSVYRKLLVEGPGCVKAGDASCSATETDLDIFQSEVLVAALTVANCAATGTTNAGTPLTVTAKNWYTQRASFWNKQYQDMRSNAAKVADGTYKFSSDFQAGYLGAVIPPVAPSLSGKLTDGTSTLTGTGQPVNAPQFPAASRIYVCVWPAKPTGGSLDCTFAASTIKPSSLANPDGTDANKFNYMQVTAAGQFSAKLNTPLTNGQFVSVVEISSPAGQAAQTTVSAIATAVGASSQCNTEVATQPYSDCDLNLSLIGGAEQSAQSSLQSETTAFLRLFTRTPISTNSPINIWAYIRLLGAPTTSSTNGVVSVVTNPSGTVTTQTFSSIGTSIDFMLGAEYEMYPRPLGKGSYSISLIAAYGGTTPLQANSLSLAYTSPPSGSVECGALLSRFQSQFALDNIIAGTTTNTTFPTTTPPTTTPSCLVNKNSPTTTSTGTTYAPVSTIGFSNQDRTSFFGKDIVGIRTIDRFPGVGNTACGTADAVNHIGPCERGIVDFTFGQDASITGGAMHNFIFKIDAIHPLPVASVSFLYLFGSASLRLSRNTNYSPLILQSANISSLTGTGTGAVPSPSVVVLSLVQPNRDFYRFGAGINITQIFTKLFAAATPTKTP